MSGYRGVGFRVVNGGGDGEAEVGAIPAAPATIAETIYVGRASFRVEVEHDGPVLSAVPTPAPAIDSSAWFSEVGAPDRERTAIIDFSSRLRASTGSEGIPVPYGPGTSVFPPWKMLTSRWSLGLPLLFGAFFCGLLLSPLAASTFTTRGKAAGAPASSAAATPTPATTTTPVAVPPAPAPAATPPATPVVAPITPIEPPRAHQLNLVAGILGNPVASPAATRLVPVQGRAMKKPLARKAAAPRRSGHPALAATADPAEWTSAPAMPGEAPRPAVKKHAWVDPWADN